MAAVNAARGDAFTNHCHSVFFPPEAEGRRHRKERREGGGEKRRTSGKRREVEKAEVAWRYAARLCARVLRKRTWVEALIHVADAGSIEARRLVARLKVEEVSAQRRAERHSVVCIYYRAGHAALVKGAVEPQVRRHGKKG